jgi:hypothetical protein
MFFKKTPVGLKLRRGSYNHSRINFSHWPMNFIYKGMFWVMQSMIDVRIYFS